jgi:hypothetical protein
MGQVAIDKTQRWFEEGLAQIPSDTPYNYRGGIIFNPGYTSYCEE